MKLTVKLTLDFIMPIGYNTLYDTATEGMKLTTDQILMVQADLDRIGFALPLSKIRYLGSQLYLCNLLEDVCTCGKDNCFHIKLLIEMLTNDKSPERFNIVSQFHKELRRGCINKATIAGKWLHLFRGRSGVSAYLRSIAFEETRNPDLIVVDNPEEGIKAFCRSKKKWELKCFHAGRKYFYDACWEFAGIQDPEHRGELASEKCLNGKPFPESFEEAMKMFAYLYIAGKNGTVKFDLARIYMENWYGSMIETRVPADVKDGLMFYCNPRPSEWNRFETVLHYAYGGLTHEEASSPTDVFIDEDEDERLEFHFQWYPSYVFDSHVFWGKKRLEKDVPKILRGDWFNLDTDLRWSGITLGEFWRSQAYQLFNTGMLTRSWEEVIMGTSLNEVRKVVNCEIIQGTLKPRMS